MLRYLVIFLVNFLSGTRFFGIKRLLLRLYGFKIGNNVKIVGPIYFDLLSLTVGDDVWIGSNLFLFGNGKIIIGNNVDIAPFVKFFTGSHYTGTHSRRAGDGFNTTIVIGSGSWLGGACNIGPNVEIGDSSIIAFGSNINKSVKKNSLVVSSCQIVKKYNL